DTRRGDVDSGRGVEPLRHERLEPEIETAPAIGQPGCRGPQSRDADIDCGHGDTTSRYPAPRTVCTISGLVGSRSILRRSRLICTSTARSLTAPPGPASAM